MTTMVDLHAKTDPDSFKPEVRNLGIHSAAPTFHLAFDALRHFGVFLSHDQMIDLRDALTGAIAESTVKCFEPKCEEVAVSTCECDKRFCADHGQKAGDEPGGTNPNGSPFGEHSYPSICDACIERSRA